MLNRRNLLQGIAAGAGSALTVSMDPQRLLAATDESRTTKRVIFFMQNQGFDPKTCIPEGMPQSGSLANKTAFTSSTVCTALIPARPTVHFLEHLADTVAVTAYHQVRRPLTMKSVRCYRKHYCHTFVSVWTPLRT